MKKLFAVLIIGVLIVEVVLFLRLRAGKDEDNPGSEKEAVATENPGDLRKELANLRQENADLRKQADEAAGRLPEMEKELREAKKAIETLQTGVTGKFEEYQKKATALDQERKAKIGELEGGIQKLKDEMVALGAQLNGEIKQRDAQIVELKKSIDLTNKILGEEKARVAELEKQFGDEKGKTEVLANQVKALTTERDSLRGQLQAEQKKASDLAAENAELKKRIDELSAPAQ